MTTLVCARCGRDYTVTPSAAATSRYCSRACYRPSRPEVRCRRCGRTYLPRNGTRGAFCSMACYRGEPPIICPACGTSFRVKPSQKHRRVYCSLACRKSAPSRARTVRERLPVSLTCERCGQTFEALLTPNAPRRFCSQRCRLGDAAPITKPCLVCGKPFTRRRALARKRRHCSRYCATETAIQQKTGAGYIGRKRRDGIRTEIESKVEAVLLELGILYMFEHGIGRYSVDFALPQRMIALECDGRHHATVAARARDAARDAALAGAGWRVIHLPRKDIKRDALGSVRIALGM